jgi:hypothetical protein
MFGNSDRHPVCRYGHAHYFGNADRYGNGFTDGDGDRHIHLYARLSRN